MKVVICPNPFRDIGFAVTGKAVALLKEAGFEALVSPIFSDGTAELPGDLPLIELREAAQVCALAVVIGGDGTILAAVRGMGEKPLPVLGVNLGTKGFMAPLEPERLPLIVEAAKGNYVASERMMLDVLLEREGQAVCRDVALNDAVIHGYGECVNITVWCDGERVTHFSGDGVIVSSPTGSTGYSMSAGGPIVEPGAEALILSPICAHTMGARPFVIGAGRTITVSTEKLPTRRAYLSVDGNPGFDLCNGDILTVRRSDRRVTMLSVGGKSFYENAYEKLI